MAVTPLPVFTQGVQSAQCVCTAAKTDLTIATGAVLLMTAGANGAVVYSVRALPRNTIVATQAQLYRSPDAGVTLNLIDLATIGAYTLATGTSTPKTDFGYTESLPLRLAANERLYAGIGILLASGVLFDVQYENL